MNCKLNKTMLAAGVAMALGGPSTALAIPGINFDANGTNGGGLVIGATRFNWTNQAVLAQDLFDDTAGTTALSGLLMGHGSLDTISFGGSGSVGASSLTTGTITYQYSIGVSASINAGKGDGRTVTFADNADVGSSNFFNVYFDPTPGIILASGAGFGTANGEVNADQMLILSGKLSLNSFLSNGFTAIGTDTSTPVSPLDTATPNALGPWTIGGSGSLNFDINVCEPSEAGAGKCASFAPGTGDTVNTDFFLSDVSSLTLDVNLNGGIQSLFDQFRPPANILNNAALSSNLGSLESGPYTGTRYVNDYDCGGAGGTCDMVYQGQNGLSRWNHTIPVPEPTGIALAGLAISAAGFATRRRQKGKSKA